MVKICAIRFWGTYGITFRVGGSWNILDVHFGKFRAGIIIGRDLFAG